MADSEPRQKFEAWKIEALKRGQKFVSHLDVFAGGMRAGEIARWIPVEERMPDSDGEFWVWLVPHKPQPSCMEPDEMVFVPFPPHADRIRTWINREGKRRFNCAATQFPTHWQPLPAAPEEKKPALSGAEESKEEEA